MSKLEDKNLYNQFPYPSGLCYAQTHPNRMAVIATVLGLNPPAAERCRLLELGCAGGGNILPMAENLPDSEFVGVDYTARHIEEATQVAEILGLKNIRFEYRNIMEVGPDFGEFDYIVVHGIYSWVPEPVREQILTICSRNLAPNGIAYVSYNAYPGWHMLDATRTMMRYRTRNIEDPQRVVIEARRLINFLAESLEGDEHHYSGFLNSYVESFHERWQYFKALGGTLLLHDDLGQINRPFYFYQFAADAARHGLQFLSEADLPDSVPTNFPPKIVNVLNALAEDPIEMEQYMDFLRSRTFRRTLLCHEGLEIERGIKTDAERLKIFRMASWAKPDGEEFDVKSDEPLTFKASDESLLATDHPVSKAALVYLSEISPRNIAFEELLAEARRRIYDNPAGTDGTNEDGGSINGDDVQTLATTLITGFSGNSQLVELNLYVPPFTLEVSEKPVASPIARYHATQEADMVPNLRHERVSLDLIHMRLLPYLDGERDQDALLDIMIELAEDGILAVQDKKEQPVTDKAQIREILGKELAVSLEKIAQAALLIG